MAKSKKSKKSHKRIKAHKHSAKKAAPKKVNNESSMRKNPAKIIAVDKKHKTVVVEKKKESGATTTSVKSLSEVKKDIKGGRKYFIKKQSNKVVIANGSIKTKADRTAADNLPTIKGTIKNRYSYPRSHYTSKICFALVMMGFGMLICVSILSVLVAK